MAVLKYKDSNGRWCSLVGGPSYEDKKLAESTSTTTMTTEGVLLKGTDGAFYEIDKASLSEVISAEQGNILADNSKNNGTSVSKVPTINSTGNALGASSVADLVSVLCAAKAFTSKKDVLSSEYNNGVFLFYMGTNVPSNAEWFFTIGHADSQGNKFKLGIDFSNGKLYTWTSGTNTWNEK